LPGPFKISALEVGLRVIYIVVYVGE